MHSFHDPIEARNLDIQNNGYGDACATGMTMVGTFICIRAWLSGTYGIHIHTQDLRILISQNSCPRTVVEAASTW